MLRIVFTGRISKRRRQVLVLLPRDYWELLRAWRGRQVRVRFNDDVEYDGHITEIDGRVYVSLPRSALALRELALYHLVRVEIR